MAAADLDVLRLELFALRGLTDNLRNDLSDTNAASDQERRQLAAALADMQQELRALDSGKADAAKALTAVGTVLPWHVLSARSVQWNLAMLVDVQARPTPPRRAISGASCCT